jgi:hypothetical protein
VASRKAVVVKAVIYGLIPQSEALERYALSEEEFAALAQPRSNAWRKGAESHGHCRNTDNFKLFCVVSFWHSNRHVNH